MPLVESGQRLVGSVVGKMPAGRRRRNSAAAGPVHTGRFPLACLDQAVRQRLTDSPAACCSSTVQNRGEWPKRSRSADESRPWHSPSARRWDTPNWAGDLAGGPEELVSAVQGRPAVPNR